MPMPTLPEEDARVTPVVNEPEPVTVKAPEARVPEIETLPVKVPPTNVGLELVFRSWDGLLIEPMGHPLSS